MAWVFELELGLIILSSSSRRVNNGPVYIYISSSSLRARKKITEQKNENAAAADEACFQVARDGAFYCLSCCSFNLIESRLKFDPF